MLESYIKWLEDGKPKVFCQCGCNKEIIIVSYHSKRGIPKYLRGHFIRSEEQNRNMSKRLSGENNPFYGKHHTKEQCDKWKQTRKGKLTGDDNPAKRSEVREKISQKKKGVPIPKLLGNQHAKGNIPWNKGKTGVYSEETLKQNSEWHKGKISYWKGKKRPELCGDKNPSNRPEVKKIKSEKLSGKNNPRYGKPPAHTKHFYYNSPLQGQVCFRSSWELKYAKYLDSNKILWMYEGFTFDLNDDTYTPDFYLPKTEKFIEVKGYMRPKHQEKINKFLEQYPWDLEILRKKDLIKLGVFI